MAEIEPLEIQFRSGGVDEANRKLAELAATSQRAEKATEDLEAAQKKLDADMLALSRSASKAAAEQRKLEEAQKKAAASALAEVKKSLFTEEEAIRDSYNRRRRIIIESTAEASTKTELLNRLHAQQAVQLKGIGSAADSAKVALLGMLGPAAAIASAISAVSKVMTIQREFDKINAGLITATGSAENASRAFEAIQDFASTTPNSLQETASAFVKLVNLGLDPSERALRSYGNTASALGKNLDQMIEAVADAAVGEFERLKEFGIKAKSEGDKVTFTFRGVTTTVWKNSAEIESYLRRLGEVEFAGAMETRMRTLDGALSNLGDAWDKFALSVSKSGLNDFLAETVLKLTSLLEVAGELVKKYGGQVASAAKGAAVAMVSSPAIQTAASLYSRYFPEQKLIVTEDSGEKEIDRLAKFRAEKAALDRAGDSKELSKLTEHLKTRREKIEDEYKEEQALLSRSRQSGAISFDRFQELSNKATEKYMEDLKGLNKKTRKTGPTEKQADSFFAKLEYQNREAFNKQVDDAMAAFDKELAELKTSLQSQEDSVKASYTKRKAFLEKYAGEDQPQLLAKLEEQWGKHVDDLAKIEQEKYARRKAAVDDLGNEYLTEYEQMLAAQERKRRAILENEDLTGEQKLDLERKWAKRSQEERDAFDQARLSASLGSSSQFFSSLAEVEKNFGAEKSGTYKALFAASKAFGVANATMSMYAGAADALKLGWPAGIPAGLAVLAQGAQLLAQITSVSYAGGRAIGGSIPSGSVALVGEGGGPELVRGPATVISTRDTAAALNGGRRQNIKIVVAPSQEEARKYLHSSEGERTFVSLAKSNSTTLRTIAGA